MVTKKSSKSKSKKIQKNVATQQSFRKTVLDAIVIAIAITIVGCLIAVGAFAVTARKTNMESQKIQAFDSLVHTMLYETNTVDGEQSVEIGETGITEDGDLYVDFTRIKYENHVPVAKQPARIHFQCSSNDDVETVGCAHAYWYGEWKKITE